MAEHGEKKIGLNLYSLRDFVQTRTGLTQTLKRVKSMGYQGVQVSGIRSLTPQEIAEAAQTVGIPIAATHMAWEDFTRRLDQTIRTHQLYHCTHAAIGGLPDDYRSAAGAQRFCDELPPVLEGLSAAGMDFSYHNHNHELARYDGITWLERVFEATAALPLNFEIDTYWIQAGGADPWAWVSRCRGRIPLLHLKDMAITPEREQRFAPVGDGNLDWDRILEAAEQGGVQWYLVEQDQFYEEDPFDQVERSCRFLRTRLLGE